MTADLRPLPPGEHDPELLALGGSAGALACGYAWMANGLPLPPCALYAITGCPCPTCGATRCVLALLHGRVGEAFGWNPMVFAGLAALALVNLYTAAALVARLPRLRLSVSRMEGRVLRVAFVITMAANWTYEIHRLA
jgi:hypothetical protein